MDSSLVDLASRRLGGLVLAASDEFFAPKERLLAEGAPSFELDRYGDRGKEMDGWETRRRRDGGSDWCVVRLGVPGVLAAAVVDTSHFTGNHPVACELEGTLCDEGPPGEDARWFPLLKRVELRGDSQQVFALEAGWRVSHVRFVIHPDGGVARLRLLGRPLVDLHRVADAGGRLDLAAVTSGGRAVACSDDFYSSPANLVMVGDARGMWDGWETRRRRGPGEDWAVVELATTGLVERVEVDTTHFIGNHPECCTVALLDAPGAAIEDLEPGAPGWRVVVDAAVLQPHARRVFDVAAPAPATHLRLHAVPDGGVARLRAFGVVTEDGWRRAGVALLDSTTPEVAEEALLACCGSRSWAAAMVARRPFGDPAALTAAADEVWEGLPQDDQREAFAAHPRIGERRASGWSAQEQAAAADASPDLLAALKEGNRRYEERFGHVFLIRAAGRGVADMLAALHERLGNDPDTEHGIAAVQQRKITRGRLDALLREGRVG